MTQMTLGDRLRAYTGTNPFIKDIASKAHKGLTDKQVAAVVAALKREDDRAATRIVLTTRVDAKSYKPIVDWLAATAKHLQYPKFHFIVNDEELTLRFKTKGMRPGTADVTTYERFWNEKFQSDAPRWFGRIETDGQLTMGGMMTLDIEAALSRIVEDPLRAATEFGRLTNRCAFCHRDLNTAESVELGYGPVCAKKHGLAHNKAAAGEKKSFRERMGLDEPEAANDDFNAEWARLKDEFAAQEAEQERRAFASG